MNSKMFLKFSDYATSNCGDKIVEQSEECDCGLNENDCAEKCCYPRDVGIFLQENPRAKGCTLKPGMECSPSMGDCCSKTCNFVPITSNKQCNKASECSKASFCDGRNATCPKPISLDDGLSCASDTRVCIDGECIGSICIKFELQECFLTSELYDVGKQCEVACQKGRDNSTCRGSSDMPYYFKKPMFLESGEPCDDNRGFCDEFSICHHIAKKGPLVNLLKSLLNVNTWMAKYWWVVILLCVLLIVVIGLFIKCCVHRVSSFKSSTPASAAFFQTVHHQNSTIGRRRPHLSDNTYQQPLALSPLPLSASTLSPPSLSLPSRPPPPHNLKHNFTTYPLDKPM